MRTPQLLALSPKHAHDPFLNGRSNFWFRSLDRNHDDGLSADEFGRMAQVVKKWPDRSAPTPHLSALVFT